ncbi:hypothetical protein HU200_052443 [Digitaria exilis]|uniref:Uncharacterized protein n=1 Tax=Digitaria exilis TaxID=1010633 RepID=A0A835ATZ1_9POAL|nr:hypothetical protein HU200_052443 [Digitaria exilis]
MAELARGALAPTVPPVWERELLEGRSRPQAAIVEDDMDEVPDCCDINGSSSSIKLSVDNKMSLCSLFFGPREIAAIPAQLLPDIQKHVSNFDIIAGWLWKFGTVAMAPDSNEVMSLVMAVDARGRKTTKAADGSRRRSSGAKLGVSGGDRFVGKRGAPSGWGGCRVASWSGGHGIPGK